ncbi:hypothetical protein H5410_015499 [Solanum commersonii]|uniref:Uncharacterized protein n=1 Tax=Solanum commersonii TaxID=4109 RepID=A0A9J5ZU99_SOLCO|nr:hypothetical protein H5410_015499 [Solanum commersonii]
MTVVLNGLIYCIKNKHKKHVYREGNQLVDVIANSAYSKSKVQEYKQFEQLPANCRRILNTGRTQIASLRITTRKIKDINNQYGPQ